MNFNNLFKEINHHYDNLINKFTSEIDTTKTGNPIGGTFYGSTELFSSRSSIFNKSLNYRESGRYHSTDYDFVIKVGSLNDEEFGLIKQDLMTEFHHGMKDILINYGFEMSEPKKAQPVTFEKIENNQRYQVFLINDVTYGTNFSIYCGLIFNIYQDKDDYKISRINHKTLSL